MWLIKLVLFLFSNLINLLVTVFVILFIMAMLGIDLPSPNSDDETTEVHSSSARIADGAKLSNSLPVASSTMSDMLSAEMEVTQTTAVTLIDGVSTAFDAYEIAGSNYFKLRDIAYALSGSEKQFDVGWSEAENTITLTSGVPYTVVGGELAGGNGEAVNRSNTAKTPVPTDSKNLLDGIEIELTAYQIDGSNYFKIRDIGKAFDFDVDWDVAANTIVINTRAGYTE